MDLVENTISWEPASPAKSVVAQIANHFRTAFILLDQSVARWTLPYFHACLVFCPSFQLVLLIAIRLFSMVRLSAQSTHFVFTAPADNKPSFIFAQAAAPPGLSFKVFIEINRDPGSFQVDNMLAPWFGAVHQVVFVYYYSLVLLKL